MKRKSFFILAMLLVAFAGNAQTGKDLDINDDGAADLSDVSILIDYILNPPGFANQTFTVKGVNFDMIAVDGGTFTMGATEEQGSEAYNSEKPTHPVTLSSYYIGKTEVTQELWEAVMGSNPSDLKGSNLPVENVFWEDCQTSRYTIPTHCRSYRRYLIHSAPWWLQDKMRSYCLRCTKPHRQ